MPSLSIREMAQKEGWSTKDGSKWRTMPEQMIRYLERMVKEYPAIITIEDGEIKSDEKYPTKYHEMEADKK